MNRTLRLLVIFLPPVMFLTPVVARAHVPLPSLDDATCVQCHEPLVTKKVVHAPAMGGGCSSCHVGSMNGGEVRFTVAAKGDALCFSCHAGTRDQLKKPAVHAAFRDLGCTSCHNPHSADTPRLLASPVPDLCLTCHADKRADEKAISQHPPFMAGDCLACHVPHASDLARLLATPAKETKGGGSGTEAPVNSVCSSCHDQRGYQRHPVAGHPTSGRPDMSRPGKNLSCVSCHSPHQSQFRRLFYETDSTFVMCTECHSKGKRVIK